MITVCAPTMQIAMKEHDRDGEDQKRSVREQFEQPAAHAVVANVARLAAAGTFEINLLTAYKKIATVVTAQKTAVE
jgi:hypothetical protein